MLRAFGEIEKFPVSANGLYTPDNIYIMFEDVEINWTWRRDEVKEFDSYIKAGFGMFDTGQLSAIFGRTEEEVALMMIDRTLIDGIAKDITSCFEPYIMLENTKINWFWNKRDVVMFDLYYKSGVSVQSIAAKFSRPLEEIVIMTFDRALRGEL